MFIRNATSCKHAIPKNEDHVDPGQRLSPEKDPQPNHFNPLIWQRPWAFSMCSILSFFQNCQHASAAFPPLNVCGGIALEGGVFSAWGFILNEDHIVSLPLSMSVGGFCVCAIIPINITPHHAFQVLTSILEVCLQRNYKGRLSILEVWITPYATCSKCKDDVPIMYPYEISPWKMIPTSLYIIFLSAPSMRTNLRRHLYNLYYIYSPYLYSKNDPHIISQWHIPWCYN